MFFLTSWSLDGLQILTWDLHWRRILRTKKLGLNPWKSSFSACNGSHLVIFGWISRGTPAATPHVQTNPNLHHPLVARVRCWSPVALVMASTSGMIRWDYIWLVVWNIFMFPTDFHIFRGVETTNQIYNYLILFMFLGWLKATNQNFIIYNHLYRFQN